MSVAKERYLELAVSNKTTDNKYSYRNGIAQLNFQIPEGNYMLDPTSVRICGGIRFYTGLDKTNASNVPGASGGKQELSVSSRLNADITINSFRRTFHSPPIFKIVLGISTRVLSFSRIMKLIGPRV